MRDVLIVDDESACWLWRGSLGPTGYGRIAHWNKKWVAHRASYTIFKGPIPKGMYVLHNCHVRNCVNPEHLKLGTQQDNMEDMIALNRQVNLRGGEHGDATLTDEEAGEVLWLCINARHCLTHQQIGERYQTTLYVVDDISSRKSWKHVLPIKPAENWWDESVVGFKRRI
jgi:hypothetical protein